MKYKAIYIFIIASFMSMHAATTFATEEQATQDDNIVVGACMIQKFKENKPPISQDAIEKCANSSSDNAAKCLGLSNDTYLSMIKFCISQLKNAKCVADKMKVTLTQYADCKYEQDPAACYKGLGYKPDAIVKLSTDCQNEGAI